MFFKLTNRHLKQFIEPFPFIINNNKTKNVSSAVCGELLNTAEDRKLRTNVMILDYSKKCS